jgi:putative ABC transport system permease protein
MELTAAVRLAMRAINRHRLRSALTLLGVTIGVAVVIVMVAIGAGAQRSIEQQVRAAGANLITVTAGNYSPGDQDPSSGDVVDPDGLAGGAGVSAAPVPHKAVIGGGWAGMSVAPRVAGRGASTALSVDDGAVIVSSVRGVRSVAPGVTETLVMWFGRASVFGRLQGTGTQLPDMRAMPIREGRFFTERETQEQASVLVLSSTAAEKLFGSGVRAVGQTVRIRQADFQVIGVAARSASLSGSTGPSLDEAYAPYTTVQRLLKISHLHSTAVSVEQAGDARLVALAVPAQVM